MKGHIRTDLLRAVLDNANGLRTGGWRVREDKLKSIALGVIFASTLSAGYWPDPAGWEPRNEPVQAFHPGTNG